MLASISFQSTELDVQEGRGKLALQQRLLIKLVVCDFTICIIIDVCINL